MSTFNFDRYTIISPLGAGGMADVYLAHDPRLDRRVVVKVPKGERLNDAGRKRFDREAQAVANLENGPAIVALYDYGEHDGRPYLVMRYMMGGTLAERIEAGRFSLDQATPIIERIAQALDYAHVRRIVHRDVKPANILFDGDGLAYLADFGIATAPLPDAKESSEDTIARLTALGASPGTPGYRSPEQAQGVRDLDGRSDIYSLGVVLYQMLTGEVPEQASIPLIGAARPDLPAELQLILNRALARDRDARYGRASDMARDLSALLAGQPVAAAAAIPPASAAASSPTPVAAPVAEPAPVVEARPARPSPALLLLIGLTVVALGLSAFALVRGLRGDNATATPLVAVVTRVVENTPAPPSPAETATPDEPTPPPTPAETTAPSPAATDSPSPTAPQAVVAGPQPFTLGQTVRGTAIEGVRLGSGPRALIFVGGMAAGFAPSTVALARAAIDHFTLHPEEIPPDVTLVIIPSASPDAAGEPGGYDGRLNANGVDVNRNWDCQWTADPRWGRQLKPGSGGTAPFSENESRLLRDLILAEGPAAVIFWQARAENGLVSAGGCGEQVEVSAGVAAAYARGVGYELENYEDFIGQALNGDASNWLDSVGVPAASVLLTSFTDIDWPRHRDGMLTLLAEVAGGAPPVGGVAVTIPAARPTAAPPACAYDAGPRGAGLWATYRDRLGCATNAERRVFAVFQYYEGGTMIWREDLELVYVLYDGGDFATFAAAGPEEYFHSDLLKGSFGYLWNNNATVRQRIGPPEVMEMVAGDFTIQDFAGGVTFYFNDSGGQTVALLADESIWVMP